MTARRNESVGRIIGTSNGAVQKHVAVEVVRYGVLVEYHQTVVGVILKTALRRFRYVACRVVYMIIPHTARVVKKNLPRRLPWEVKELGNYSFLRGE